MRGPDKAADHAPARPPAQSILQRKFALTGCAGALMRQRFVLDHALAYTLAAEQPDHGDAIERVLDRAFGPGRFAKSSQRVREVAAFEPALSRVALDQDGRPVGVCRIWRVSAGAPAFFLGPLAVDPACQAVGLGLTMTRAAIVACREIGGGAVLAVGAERFFRPFGFDVVPFGRLAMPGPYDAERLLWLELQPGALDALAGQIGAP